LRALPVPSGVGALGVLEDLRRALDGSGPALVPYAADGRPPALPDVTGQLPQGLALAIGTSGSTGPPKLTMLTGNALRASADSTHARLGGQGQWLLALPPHHIAGLQVLVRSIVAGTTPVCMDLRGGFTAAAFVRATDEVASGSTAQPAYTALVPTQLVRLLASAEGSAALSRYAAVLVGGAAAPASLLARARALGVAVVTTYGMSETAGGCVYDGHPLDVSRVHLEQDGRIRLGGATLAQGYLGEPELTAQSFSRASPASPAGPAGPAGPDPNGTAWFRTDDLGHLDGDTLVVDGRIDTLINTGGLKVVPGRVEAALVQLDTIAEAVVVGTADPEWGQVVSAAVVATPGGAPPTLGDVRDQLRGILPDHALPRRLATVLELPSHGPGKPDRAMVAKLLETSE
jgi:O-succinylbenzoic acid--CoA ligase